MSKIETSGFKKLIGLWTTQGTILTANGNSKLTGTDSYEFILDGNYILHKAAVTLGDEKIETYEIISLDSSGNKANMQYYNSKGESGGMIGTFYNNSFKIEGDKIKFQGDFNDEYSSLIGKWYSPSGSGEWAILIDLELTKYK